MDRKNYGSSHYSFVHNSTDLRFHRSSNISEDLWLADFRILGSRSSRFEFIRRSSTPLSRGGNCHAFSDDDEGALVEKCEKCALRISERAERIIHSNVSRELILSSFCIPSNYHRERCVWRVAACRMQIPTTSLSRICARYG